MREYNSSRCPAIGKESINSTGRGAAIAAPPVYKQVWGRGRKSTEPFFVRVAWSSPEERAQKRSLAGIDGWVVPKGPSRLRPAGRGENLTDRGVLSSNLLR